MINWEDEFVPKSVKDNIVLSPSNHSKHKGYMHNFNENNLENNMHTAISDYNKLQSSFLSRCVFSNIDRMHHYSILKLISMVNNLANNNGKKTKPLIMYSTNSHPICMNNWEDEHYFTGVFPMLFPFGDGEHLAKHKTVISLQVWAK